jgi:uncharacterized protein (TIGR02246 family)
MKRNGLKIIFAVLIVLSLLATAAWSQSKGMDADNAAINSVIAGYVGAFNHHDAHALAMFCASNGDMTNSAGETSHGRQEIEAHFTPRFAEGGALKTALRTFTVKSIDILRPDLAIAYADSEMSGLKTRDGGDVPARKMLYDITLMKQDSHWVIANFHEMDAPRPAAPPPAK